MSQTILNYESPALALQQPLTEDKSHRWVVAFIAFQIACGVALLVPGIGPARFFFRLASFASSLTLLIMLRRRIPGHHPAAKAVGFTIATMVIGLINSETQIIAGLAQIAFYIAILSPIFWTSRLNVKVDTFRHVAIIYWSFQALSALFGVLQVRYPGSFLPDVNVITAGKRDWEAALSVTLASGETVLRPMGLTDQPGGASSSGLYTVIFGLGLYLTSKSKFAKAVYLASLPLGLFCIYLALIRTTFVLVALAQIAILVALLRQRAISKFNQLLVLVSVITFFTLSVAFTVGGATVQNRIMSLFTDSPSEVYQGNRGHFLRTTIEELLPQYPWGAGAGRWGMMNNYFGEKGWGDNSLWAEIMWTGWLYDGGILLILTNIVALGITLWFSWTIARDRTQGDLAFWGAIVFAYNLCVVALLFTYPVFASGMGMEFWLLNGMLYAAWRYVQAHQQGPTLVPAVESESRS